MKKIILTVLIASIAVVGLTGCNRKAKPSAAQNQATDAALAAKTKLADRIKKGSELTNMKYFLTITRTDGEKVNAEVWLKDGKVKSQVDTSIPKQGEILAPKGEVIVTIITPTETIVYMPNLKKAFKAEIEGLSAPSSPMQETNSLKALDFKIIGAQNIDWKDCQIIEYALPQGSAKAWVWEEQGLVIRLEITSEGKTTIMEYNNIILGNVTDADFKLPVGVKIEEE